MNDDTSSTLASVERKIHAIKNTLPKQLTPAQPEGTHTANGEKASAKDSSQPPNQTLLLLDNANADDNNTMLHDSDTLPLEKADDAIEDLPLQKPSDNQCLALKVKDAKDVAQDNALQLVAHELEASERASDDGIKAAINEGLAAANHQVLQAQEAIQAYLQPEEDSKAALENIASKTTMLKQMLAVDRADEATEKVVPLELTAPSRHHTMNAVVNDAVLADTEDPVADAEWTDTLPPEEKLEAQLLQQLPESEEMKALAFIHSQNQEALEKVEQDVADTSDVMGAKELEAKTIEEVASDLFLEAPENISENMPEDISDSTIQRHILQDAEDTGEVLLEETPVRQDNPIFHWLISPMTRAKKRRAEHEQRAQEAREAAKLAAQEALKKTKHEQDIPSDDVTNLSIAEKASQISDDGKKNLTNPEPLEAATRDWDTPENVEQAPEVLEEEEVLEEGEVLEEENYIKKPAQVSEAKQFEEIEAEAALTQEYKTEAKDIADAVEASSVGGNDVEEVLEQQEAIAGDEAAQLEAEGISEENPELDDNESTLQWWGDYQMEVNEMGLWQIGPTTVEVHRLEHEWRIITETSENPLDSTMEVFYPLPSSQPSLESNMRRYMFDRSAGIVNLQPNLADRAIIVKPETPFEVRNGEQITMYVSTPVWIKITTPGAQNPLRSIPSFRSPDIWYGEDTRTGELCYYSKLLGQLTLEGVQRRPYRAVTPMILQNRSKEPLLIERIRLPMRYLSLYAAKDNFLWTSKLYLIQRRNNHTRIRVDRGAPHEMGEHHLVAHAELKMPRYLRMSAFSRFNFARGGDS